MTIKNKVLTTALGATLLAGGFGAGMYAENVWSSYDESKIERSQANVDEIMNILRDLSAENISLEEALAELEDMNPKGLVEKIKDLEAQLGEKDGRIDELVSQVEAKAQEVEAKQQEINDKNAAYDKLQQERDGLSTERDNAVAERDNALAELENSSSYITHLEQELQKANEYGTMAEEYTGEKLEEAKSLAGEE